MTEKESSSIVAVFKDMAQAKKAYDDLRSAGYGDDHLGLADTKVENKKMAKQLTEAGVAEDDSQFYQREFNEGHPLVTVRVGGLQHDSIQKAINILKQNGAYDANSGRNSQAEFGSNVKTDAPPPYFDIIHGAKESGNQ